MELDEIKKLSPKERKKRLQDRIKDYEKKIKEAKKLVELSDKEIKQKEVEEEIKFTQQPAQLLEEAVAESPVLGKAEEIADAETTAAAVYITKTTPTYYLTNVARELMLSPLVEQQKVIWESIGRATSEKLADFYKGNYVPDNQAIVEELSLLAQVAKQMLYESSIKQ